MDIQYTNRLSQKSKGILYRLKTKLAKEKTTLKGLIGNIFGFHKTKFNPKQFNLLILQYDSNLVLKDIDELFDSLDESKNQVIFYENLQNVLNAITQQDNPSLVLNKRSKLISNNASEKKKIDCAIQLKDKLLLSQDYLEVICLFASEKDGFLTKQNVGQLLNSFQYNDQMKRTAILQYLFEDKNKISVKNLVQKLGLQSVGTRIHLSQSPQKQKNKIKQQEKSEFIIEQQKSRIRENSMRMSHDKFEQNMRKSLRTSYNQDSIHYSLQNIPNALQPYFNYGSELEQPFASYASQYISKGLIFVDESNPTYSRARNWVHLAEVNPSYQLFEVAKSIIRRDNTRKGLGAMLQPKDIIQGSIGDCYFLSAIAAIVQDYPQLVYRLFVLEKNPSHMFGVKLFIDGVWTTITLDACFPVNNFRGFCGAQPHHGEVWVMLLEKAWAKIFKSYDNIIAGYNYEGLIAISGAPAVQVSSKKDGFLKNIIAQFGKGSIITCATSRQVTQLTDRQQQQLGVFAGHAYTLLKVYENLPYKNTKITLLKIRNPWGRKGWKGDWSFNSPTWTKQLRQRVGYEVDPQDGSFLISLADFVVYFDFINISKVNLAYRNSHVCINGNRFNFMETRFKISDRGDYFFTLYQQNGRKYKNMSTVYELSKSWLFLAKIVSKSSNYKIEKITAIACVSSFHHNPTIQTTLEPGQYVLISKVSWRYWEQHIHTITSYGPSKVLFSEAIVASTQIINKFIESRADEISRHGGGSMHVYENKNISKRVDFSLEDGIGFVTVNNFEEYIFETTIFFEPCKGLLVLPPFSLPIKLYVMPYQIVTVGFIVDPQGYNYSMKEKYYFRRAY